LIVSLVSVGTNVRYILPSNYCMFYYVSMRLISTSINQWLLWFCLASLRSCYRNHILSRVILYLLTKVAMPVLQSTADKWSHHKGATTYRNDYCEWIAFRSVRYIHNE